MMPISLHTAADEFLRFACVRDSQPELFTSDPAFGAGYVNARLRLAIALGYPVWKANESLCGVTNMPDLPDEAQTRITELSLELAQIRNEYDRFKWETSEKERLRRINKK